MLFRQEMGYRVKWALRSDAVDSAGRRNLWKWETDWTSSLVDGDSDHSHVENTDAGVEHSGDNNG